MDIARFYVKQTIVKNLATNYENQIFNESFDIIDIYESPSVPSQEKKKKNCGDREIIIPPNKHLNSKILDILKDLDIFMLIKKSNVAFRENHTIKPTQFPQFHKFYVNNEILDIFDINKQNLRRDETRHTTEPTVPTRRHRLHGSESFME